MAVDVGLEAWSREAIPIDFVDAAEWEAYAAQLPPPMLAFARASGFEPKPGKLLLAPGADGAVARVLFAVAAHDAGKARPVPRRQAGDRVAGGSFTASIAGPPDPAAAALAFLLSRYRFSRYVEPKSERARLCAPAGTDAARLARIAGAIAMGRDLVNTPTNDMGPEALAAAALELAERHCAKSRVIVGGALLTENFPLIHAVGRASARAPRLVDFVHGPLDAIEGDAGRQGRLFRHRRSRHQAIRRDALDEKGHGRRGGGVVAGLDAARRRRSRAPARHFTHRREFSVGRRLSAGRVYPSRKGLSVEIGNTDAEGRLVLADALALACEDEPDLLFDFATLTGAAARRARPGKSAVLHRLRHARARHRATRGSDATIPPGGCRFGTPTIARLDGKISDVVNVTSHAFAGSITAALFLRRFVVDPKRWAHFDVYCWNGATKPRRPEGGEIQIARLLYDLIEARARDRSKP